MSVFFSDTYSGGSGADIDTHVSDSGHHYTNFASSLEWQSGQLYRNPSNGTCRCYVSDLVPPSPDYTVTAQLIEHFDGVNHFDRNFPRIGLRFDPVTQNEYGVDYDPFNGFRITKDVGAGSVLASDPTTVAAGTHILVIDISGSSTVTISVTLDGTFLFSATDSSSPITAAGTLAFSFFSSAAGTPPADGQSFGAISASAAGGGGGGGSAATAAAALYYALSGRVHD